MLYTCSPGCADPRHRHSARTALASAASETARATAAVARTRRGKSKVVDLHCHYLNPAVNAKTAHLNAAEHDMTVVFADAFTRETNVKHERFCRLYNNKTQYYTYHCSSDSGYSLREACKQLRKQWFNRIIQNRWYTTLYIQFE